MRGLDVNVVMSDDEIAKELGLNRRMVTDIRNRAMRKVEERMKWTDEQLDSFIERERKMAQ